MNAHVIGTIMEMIILVLSLFESEELLFGGFKGGCIIKLDDSVVLEDVIILCSTVSCVLDRDIKLPSGLRPSRLEVI